MKFSIHEGVSQEQLRRIVPKQYQILVNWTTLQEEKYTLIVFRNTLSVVLSSVVEQALKHLSGSNAEPLIVLAQNITEDGLNLLRGRASQICTHSAHFWTDERYKFIQQQM
jgi:hypothetical protein